MKILKGLISYLQAGGKCVWLTVWWMADIIIGRCSHLTAGPCWGHSAPPQWGIAATLSWQYSKGCLNFYRSRFFSFPYPGSAGPSFPIFPAVLSSALPGGQVTCLCHSLIAAFRKISAFSPRVGSEPTLSTEKVASLFLGCWSFPVHVVHHPPASLHHLRVLCCLPSAPMYHAILFVTWQWREGL